MNSNSEKIRKPRFSIADFVIILIALSCIIGIAIRYDIVGKLFSKVETEKISVTFKAESLSENKLSAFTENSEFYLGDNKFGKFVSSSTSAATGYYENEAGILIKYEKEDLFDISGTFICDLVNSDNGYLLNGKTYIAPGSVLTLKSGGISVPVIITAIESEK